MREHILFKMKMFFLLTGFLVGTGLLAGLLLPIEAKAESTYVVDNLTYSVTFNGTYVSGVVEKNVDNIVIPGSIVIGETYHKVEKIGDNAFEGCNSVTSVSIPDTVTSIGQYAFCNCSSLESITIPNSVTSVGTGAFSKCTSLTSFALSEKMNDILPFTFSDCTSLAEVTIPDHIENIGQSAFSGCTSLKAINIGDGTKSIDGLVFRNCPIVNINIPSSVISIKEGAFYKCYFLKSITVSPDNKNYSSVDGVMFNKDQTVLLHYPAGKETGYTVPNNVVSIDQYAFCFSSLSSVTIPDSVKSISNYAFSDCKSLKDVHIGKGTETIQDNAFVNCDQISDVYYNGTENEWKAINISDINNNNLTNAKIHFIDEVEDEKEDQTKIGVGSIECLLGNICIDIGNALDLSGNTYKVSPENATDNSVAWSSSDMDVAVIDGNKVRGVGVGEATITCTSNDNPEATASFILTVQEKQNTSGNGQDNHDDTVDQTVNNGNSSSENAEQGQIQQQSENNNSGSPGQVIDNTSDPLTYKNDDIVYQDIVYINGLIEEIDRHSKYENAKGFSYNAGECAYVNKDLVSKLKESKVDVTIDFQHNGKDEHVTIPAGTDLTYWLTTDDTGFTGIGLLKVREIVSYIQNPSLTPMIHYSFTGRDENTADTLDRSSKKNKYEGFLTVPGFQPEYLLSQFDYIEKNNTIERATSEEKTKMINANDNALCSITCYAMAKSMAEMSSRTSPHAVTDYTDCWNGIMYWKGCDCPRIQSVEDQKLEAYYNLKKGKASIIHVQSSKKKNHFVLVVGVKDNVPGRESQDGFTINDDELLIVDPADGKVKLYSELIGMMGKDGELVNNGNNKLSFTNSNMVISIK